MKEYPNGKAEVESIGGWQFNLPFINEEGYEESNIGFECKHVKEDSVLWFYDVKGLKDGMTKDEVLALAHMMLEIGKLME
jgi:hypothetical protein